MEVLEQLQSLGTTEVIKFSLNKPPKPMILVYRHNLLQIWCYSLKEDCVSELLTIDIQDVKEIRLGRCSKDFDHLEYSTDDDFTFGTIFYGKEFVLKTLSVAMKPESMMGWNKMISIMMFNLKIPYVYDVDVWLRRQFQLVNQDGLITVKTLKRLLKDMSVKTSSRKLKKILKTRNVGCDEITLSTFATLAKEFQHDEKVFNYCFGGYIRGDKMYADNFASFLEDEQQENDISQYLHLFPNGQYMEPEEAVNLLFAKENELWNSNCSTVYQDMTHPLSHYWITSSHNTYLTGDQITSESSIEAYIRCLRQGCRCIELDCWNGVDGTPVIYHGRTITSRILFCDVINCIKENAFVTSEYPVILSIENHCNVSQQAFMAAKMKEIFGDMLVSEPCGDGETELPSPEQLKRKIIIKCKAVDTVSAGTSGLKDEYDGCLPIIKSGIIHMMPPESDKWNKYYCTLTKSKLYFDNSTCQELSINKEDNTKNVPDVLLELETKEESWAPDSFSGLKDLHNDKKTPKWAINVYPVELRCTNTFESEDTENNPSLPYRLIVESEDSVYPFCAGFSNYDDAKAWECAINNTAFNNAKKKSNSSISSTSTTKDDKQSKLSEELSKLAVYTKSAKQGISAISDFYHRKERRCYNEMSSFPEVSALKNMRTKPSQYIWYHQVSFSRVYPKGGRIGSSNYDPTSLWNAGCQMVALNYQTPDKAMQLNHGKFYDNGGCGYILKPDYLLQENFTPTCVGDFIQFGNIKLYLKITIMAARHLHQENSSKKTIVNPFVQLELFGAEFDKKEFDLCSPRLTKTVSKNGLNPFWNQEFSFKIFAPELALIRFSMHNAVQFGEPQFIGQATYPVQCMRRGYRSVQLRNGYSEKLRGIILVKCEPIQRDYL